MKVGYLYYHKSYPDDIHLCIKVSDDANKINFKQLSGEFDWPYDNKEEKLWWGRIHWVEKYMVELGPDCKAYRAIYL